jgi:hypothetical protein
MSGVCARRPYAEEGDVATREAVPRPAIAAAPALLVLRPADQLLRPLVIAAA